MQKVIAMTAAILATIILPVAVAIAGNLAPSGNAAKSAPQSSTIDVAVTNIVPDLLPPYMATEGDMVTIKVTLANNGDNQETFDVTLRDDTDEKNITSQEITLAAGASETLDLTWDTTGFSTDPPPNLNLPGKPHSLSATAVLENDSDLSNNTLATGAEPAKGVLLIPNPNPPTPTPIPTDTPTPVPPTATPTPISPTATPTTVHLRPYRPLPRLRPFHPPLRLLLNPRPNPRPSLRGLPSPTLLRYPKPCTAWATPLVARKSQS